MICKFCFNADFNNNALLQPEPEPVVGKEKKRRKLDEIVLGLSAAKEQSLFSDPTPKKQTITPSVTVIPTSAPVSSAHNQSQKPFSLTVTSVPSSSASSTSSRNTLQNMMALGGGKDSFNALLAQAEQQTMLLKKQQQQQQRKNYESLIADISKVADFSKQVGGYSHEAKVNKWLAEQNPTLADQPLGAEYLPTRRRRTRVDHQQQQQQQQQQQHQQPHMVDWKKFTGDEPVSVIHKMTGKKLTGIKAPMLKNLSTWLMDNPMYDIDPKWGEMAAKERSYAPEMHKRVSVNSSSSSNKKTNSQGRPPVLSSPTGSTSSVSSANLATSMSSSLSFPSLSQSGLSGLNSSLLSGLSGLGQFDPKNPLLMPFGGMPNMNALSSMGGLGNLTNMNLFANLASLGLPGLAGMDPSAMTGETSKPSKSSTSSSKSKGESHASSSKAAASAASNISTTNPFPFFFPNPSLLYTPLGLGGLSPFSLQPGLSYDALAQCGLLNGGLNPAASPKSKSSRAQTTTTSATATQSSASTKSSRARDAQIQQLLLPPDTHLLESLTKAAAKDKKASDAEKRKAFESLSKMLPTDFMTPDKTKKIPGFPDFNKLLEQVNPMAAAAAGSSSKKSHEQQMKEAIEQLSKTTSAELLARASMMSDEHLKSSSSKRSREVHEPVPHNFTMPEDLAPPAKKTRAEEPLPMLPPSVTLSPANTPGPSTGGPVDIEALLPPSTVVKSSSMPSSSPISHEDKADKPHTRSSSIDQEEPEQEKEGEKDTADENTEDAPKKNAKRTRGKRKSGDLMPIDPESIREKKNLRSSASRSAAAAQARAERAERERQMEEEALRAQREAD